MAKANESRDRRRAEERAEWIETHQVCRWCGAELEQAPTGRRRKFCDPSCRLGWHNSKNGRGRTTPPEYTPMDHARCSKCWLLVKVGAGHDCSKATKRKKKAATIDAAQKAVKKAERKSGS